MRTTMTSLVLSVIFVLACYWQVDGRPPPQTKPGCWYEGRRYQEGQEVGTSEPCLRCRCTQGSLRCRLRVCPRLPSPVPSGCIAGTPREEACCAELVCRKSHGRNVTARRDAVEDSRRQDNDGGCLHERVRYGPGSAMMGSRRCEYCYCISGSRRCLRPRCLLPLPGCVPFYAPYSCCPVAYNCTDSSHDSFSSADSPSFLPRYGCRVGDRKYEEGEMVREAGSKGRCDNCFCVMGGVRCVPLSCAPPLQGCAPIVRQGQCCPSTYNCSGTIQVKANQNYASYAFISKDYAKFRKETNFFLPKKENGHSHDSAKESEESKGPVSVEGRGHKATEEESTSLATTGPEAFGDGTSPRIPAKMTESAISGPREENETMDNEIPTESGTLDDLPGDRVTSAATAATDRKAEQIEITEQPTGSAETWTTKTETMTMPTPTPTPTTTTTTTTTTAPDSSGLRTSEPPTTLAGPFWSLNASAPDQGIEGKNASETRNAVRNATRDEEKSLTRGTSVTETPSDQKDSSQSLGIGAASVISVKGAATGLPSTVLMPDDMYFINVTLRTNVSVGHAQTVTTSPERSVPPDVEAILDITDRKKGHDYEYDYGEPTLPPSLPNVRIIPFVAADALVKEEGDVSLSQATNYPPGSVGPPPRELGPSVTSGTPDLFFDLVTQANRFSPPIETEGGFLPREPSYFETPYRSTDRNIEIRAGVTVIPADMTNSHRQNDALAGLCVFENRNYRHGDLLPSSGHCIICVCYYGEVACSDEKCPPLKIGCSRLENEKICCGKIICVDTEESPTVVLDRAGANAPVAREPLPSLDGLVSPDPFRDVIKTKPAPDLPSLIEDMIPYLVEHRATKERRPATSTSVPSALAPSLSVREADMRIERRPESPNGTESRETLILAATGADETTPMGGALVESQGITARTAVTLSSIFSLGGVLDLLLPEQVENRTTTMKPSVETTTAAIASSFDDRHLGAASTGTSTIFGPSTVIPGADGGGRIAASPGSTDDEIATSVTGLLKLAGCNIYGRMYPVGRIIAELSSSCLECGCTQVGVQCKRLEC